MRKKKHTRMNLFSRSSSRSCSFLRCFNKNKCVFFFCVFLEWRSNEKTKFIINLYLSRS